MQNSPWKRTSFANEGKSMKLKNTSLTILKSYQKEMINSIIPHTEIVHHPVGLTEYRLRTETFRQYLQVFVWDIGEEKHNSFFEELGLREVEYNLNWFYSKELKYTNIIRLRSYSLNTLIHELTHFIAHQCVVIGCEFTEEIPAYIMEEIFSKLMILGNGKFRVKKEFYLE